MTTQYIEKTPSGTVLYFKDKKMTIRHREDGPAVKWYNGDKEWWINDKLHREDGPAIERINGSKAWYINGRELTEEKFNARLNNLKD